MLISDFCVCNVSALMVFIFAVLYLFHHLVVDVYFFLFCLLAGSSFNVLHIILMWKLVISNLH